MRTRRWYTVFALLGLVLSSGCCCPCGGERRLFHRPFRPWLRCGDGGCSACSVSGYTPCDCARPIAPEPYIAPTPLPMPKAVPTMNLNH